MPGILPLAPTGRMGRVLLLTRSLASGYVLVAILNVIAILTGNANGELITKPLLMPLLLGWLVARAARHWSGPLTWLAFGLVFAWAGDLLLLGESDLSFLLGIGAFAVMQVCYIVAFTRVPGPGLVRAWRIALIPYVLVWALLIVLLWPGAGDLRAPVIVYSLLIVTMGVAALDLVLRVRRPYGWWVAGGAALFIVSDALIALTAFGPLTASPGTGAAIMTTYTIAQGLIVAGFAKGLLPAPAPDLDARQGERPDGF